MNLKRNKFALSVCVIAFTLCVPFIWVYRLANHSCRCVVDAAKVYTTDIKGDWQKARWFSFPEGDE